MKEGEDSPSFYFRSLLQFPLAWQQFHLASMNCIGFRIIEVQVLSSSPATALDAMMYMMSARLVQRQSLCI
jgi:hypothetical protein